MAKEFDLHPAICSILLRRGLTSSEIFHFLNPSIDTLASPFEFRDMQKAVDRIRKAVADKEKILIYGDYDVDGITGSAILYPVLKNMGADVDTHIPHRMNEGYGLNRDSLERLLEKKYKLVITVDNGITGVTQIQYLVSQGVDVIIVDHHLPKDETPPAFAIVSACAGGKGDDTLAACGLAFKLGWALTGSFKAMEPALDLVVVGTVADLADLKGENRVLLKYGLPYLAKTKRPGLRALMDIAKISKHRVTYRDIGFGIGPRINASGRMGSPETAFRLLTTEDPAEAKQLAAFLDEGNRERQRVEAKAYESAVEQIGDTSDQYEILVVGNADWHEGVLGIVASRLVDRFKKPSIVLSLKNGIGKGSGRSITDFSLFDCVSQSEELLTSFGGHAQACGLTIKEENISPFRQKLNDVARTNQVLKQESLLEIEAELSLSEIDLKFLLGLEKLAPFGPGNRKPLFLSRGARIKGDARKRGKDTLHCWITDESGRMTCEAVGFRMHKKWSEGGSPRSFDVVHQPTLVEFNGISSIQLELEDWSF